MVDPSSRFSGRLASNMPFKCSSNGAMKNRFQELGANVKARVSLLASFVGSMWIVFFLSVLFPWLHLNSHGVEPRTINGLQGVLFAPWLHANLRHILANTSGLLVLGWLCTWPTLSNFWDATIGSMLGAGLCAWLLGAPYTIHIGASGLVFGYAAYLVGRGLYVLDMLSVAVALVVVGAYGITMLVGALPLTPGISWQSHVGGAIGGILAARAGRVSRVSQR